MFLIGLAGSAVFTVAYMSFWFFLSAVFKRNDLADIAWGLGFILIAMLTLSSSESASWRPILVSTLILIWGLRSSMYFFLKYRRSGESIGYKKMRESWGKYFYVRSFFQTFISRGISLLLISLPVIYINTFGGTGLGVLDAVGSAIWLLGFVGEILPLTEAKKAWPGALKWWGLYLLALSIPYGYLTVPGPLLATALSFRAKFKEREGVHGLGA